MVIKYIITTYGKDDCMAPRMPQRTPRITTGFDQNYTCTNAECESDALTLGTELDEQTWTCNACGEAALIVMDDRAGNEIYVRRYQAQHVVKDQMVYLDNNLKTAYFVLGSRQGTGKVNGSKWMLGLAELRGVYYVPDQYVNCVP